MEKLESFEHVPTKEELTRLVDSFAETVKCLMDVKNARTETIEDVKHKHRNDVDGMETTAYDPKPLSVAAKYYRKTVLEDGTEIKLIFNPDNPLDDGAVPVKIEIKLPADRDKYIKINSLRNAQFYRCGVANYTAENDCNSTAPEQRSHGYQFVAENWSGEDFDVGGFDDVSEDDNNMIRTEILQALHKLIVDTMYQPYQRPARKWFKKLFS